MKTIYSFPERTVILPLWAARELEALLEREYRDYGPAPEDDLEMLCVLLIETAHDAAEYAWEAYRDHHLMGGHPDELESTEEFIRNRQSTCDRLKALVARIAKQPEF